MLEKLFPKSKTARIVDIQRDGRLNLFTFEMKGEFFTIETFGVMSDDIDEWRKKCGLS